MVIKIQTKFYSMTLRTFFIEVLTGFSSHENTVCERHETNLFMKKSFDFFVFDNWSILGINIVIYFEKLLFIIQSYQQYRINYFFLISVLSKSLFSITWQSTLLTEKLNKTPSFGSEIGSEVINKFLLLIYC